APSLALINLIAAGSGQLYNKVGFARRGTSPIFWMPDGTNVLSGSGFVPGTRVQFSSSDIAITAASAQAGNGIYLTLKIAPDAALGPRLLQVTTPNGAAFMTGALIVVPPPPVIRGVTKEASPTGLTAVIDGENFAATSLPIVLFDGRMSTN